MVKEEPLEPKNFTLDHVNQSLMNILDQEQLQYIQMKQNWIVITRQVFDVFYEDEPYR